MGLYRNGAHLVIDRFALLFTDDLGKQAVQSRQIVAQREVLPYGGTDAGAMQLSRGGVAVCTVSVPCRYVHSACEVVDLRDVEGAQKLVLSYLGA